MPRPRKIQIPGTIAAPQVETIGDDLEQFSSEQLPEPRIPSAQELLAELLTLRQQVADLQARNRTPEQVKKATGQEVMSLEEARAEQARMLAKGLRPRSILTPEGWVVHSESARTAGSMNGAPQTVQ